MNKEIIIKLLFLILFIILSIVTIADSGKEQGVISSFHSQYFSDYKEKFALLLSNLEYLSVHRFGIFSITLSILVLLTLFCFYRFGFKNIFILCKIKNILQDKYSKDNQSTGISKYSSLLAGLGGTIGMGAVGGATTAVIVGGPGAVFWIFIAGIIAMPIKFFEVSLAHKYRKIDKNGRVTAGSFYYIEHVFSKKNLYMLGKILAVIVGVAFIFSAITNGGILQSSRLVKLFDQFYNLDNPIGRTVVSLWLSFLVGVVLIGGIKNISLLANYVVPIILPMFLLSGLVIIIINYDKFFYSLNLVVQDIFDVKAISGGILGAMIAGLTHGFVSNEAGISSSSMIYANSKNSSSVEQGIIAMFEPMIASSIISTLTGFIIIITGLYQTDNSVTGIALLGVAYNSFLPWFNNILSLIFFLLAFTTLVAWAYYGEQAWRYIFGVKYASVYNMGFCLCVYMGGVLEIKNIGLFIDAGDLIVIFMILPNIIAIILLSGEIREELKSYIARVKLIDKDI